MIVAAAENLVATGGFQDLSAREIARKIHYSPGTIYNVFDSIDEIVLAVEGRLLDQLEVLLTEVEHGPTPEAELRRLAGVYVEFTHGNTRLWNLLFEHQLPPETPLPEWYQAQLRRLLARVETALAPAFPAPAEADRQRSARVIWASVHGIVSLSSAGKLSIITSEQTRTLLDDLITSYMAGLGNRRPLPRGRRKK